MNTFKKLLALLTQPERKRVGGLLFMIFVMALLDMIGVASIMPFMAVLANPQLVETNAFLSRAFEAAGMFGVVTVDQFFFALGLLVFLLLVFSLAFKAFATYVQLRFAYMSEYSIGKRLIEGYLHQPYGWFLNRHSADLGKTILSEVATVVANGVMPSMVIVAQSAVVIAIITLLVLVDPMLAFTVGIMLSVAYVGIFKLMSGFLSRIGSERVTANQDRFTAISEAFGAAKEVKVGGLEQAYVNRFAAPAEIYAKHTASSQVVAQLPRFLLEAFAFGGMILLVLVLMARGDGFATALPIIALYAFAGYRLMPALQQIYGAVTQLRFVGPALDALYNDLMSLKSPSHQTTLENIELKQFIKLNSIRYSYPNSSKPALNSINLTIQAKTTVALVGPTGSGKTTTVDLILGLLEPQQGSLEIDGQEVQEHNRRAWQRSIGYVPQQIYLADDTVSANIAFGITKEKIDQQAVESAAKIANLHDFVINELPEGYNTSVGERGVRLSGGQRQRIGIARALYHKPQVLILDEATSALDNLTEQAVMEAVQNLGHDITIILIAHRLSTVKECDTIYLLENGEIKEQGLFYELTQSSQAFRALALGKALK